MAHATLEYIRGLRRSLAAKKAEIVGQDPDTIPGAEHNKPVPESAKQPDPETRDGTMVPNSGLTTAGAGDDSPITHTNDLKADEPALVPKKEPMVTDEADAKTAEALAAEILTSIDDWEKKQAQSLPDGATSEELVTDKGGAEPKQTDDSIPPKKEPAVSDDAMVEPGSSAQGETACASKEAAECNGKKCDGKPAECKAECKGKPAECKGNKCDGKPAECKAECKGKKDDAKTAGAFDLELTSDVLAKIAAVMLATDEGTKFAEKALSKVAGAVATERTLSFLRKQSAYAEQAVKRAEDTAASTESGAPAEIQQVADAIDTLVESGEITEDEADQLVQEIAQTANAQVPDGAGVQEEVKQVADAIDSLVESGEITEDEADQLVQDIAQAANAQVPDGAEKEAESIFTAGQRDAVLKIAQALDVDPSALAAAADEAQAGQAPVTPVDPYAQAAEATINDQVAVPPEQFDPASVPQGDVGEITVDDVADAIDTLVESGEITEDEADQLVQEIAGETATAGAAGTGDPQVSPEEVADALQSAVASGDLKPEDVQAVLGELENVPAPESATAQPAAAAAAVPAEEAAPVAPADDAKTAAANLIAAIRAARRPAK